MISLLVSLIVTTRGISSAGVLIPLGGNVIVLRILPQSVYWNAQVGRD